MNQPTLSKSDFKLASSCPQKLLYKKDKYPSANDENEFLQTLAEGGYIVGKMAQIMYEQYAKENGFICKEIIADKKSNDAISETLELLKTNEKIILFEPSIAYQQYLVRIDILIKNGNHFQLLEVKAKSHNSDEEENQKKKIKEYIDDIAFQTYILQLALAEHKTNFPNANIKSFLFTPDKSKRTQIDNLASWFSIGKKEKTDSFNSITVDFLQTGREKDLWKNGNSILQKVDVNDQVQEILPEIIKSANQFLKYLNKKEKINIENLISKECFKCEYKNPNDTGEKDGYKECLGKRAYAENHISELYFGGTIGGKKNPIINELLRQNKALTIFDFNETDFVDAKGKIGSRNERQIIQYENAKSNSEYFSEELHDLLDNWKYPLHFIDFETYTNAIPLHKGMRPYETVAFQWSCHTIEKEGDAPKHYEWINTENSFPNFRFAEALLQQIGDKGTPLMWATHENTVLKKILEQLEDADNYVPNYKNEKLKQWLIDITSVKKDDKKAGRLVDMNAFTLKHYFHPYMKGKTSIKKTLPAVWNHNDFLHKIPYFKPYFKKENGIILNPYETLKYKFTDEDIDKIEQAELNETVKEGGAAMRAYCEMQLSNDVNKKERLKKELLNYCELDTMAMVIIWHYWRYSQN